MEILSIDIVNMEDYGKTSKGLVYKIHVKITDVESRAKEIIQSISNKSWINNLGVVEQMSYAARAEKTIVKLVTQIFEKVDDTVTEEFGEYLVSESARDSLINHMDHKFIPLAEIWKEKITGNPGFDFHTESSANLITFGEAKYSSNSNPHTIAINQIVGFIDDKKDIMDFVHLKNFASDEAMQKAINGEKAYVAAFSINGQQYERIFRTAIESDCFEKLLEYPELYLIGVEI
ncbi:hypothetical protein [Paludibacter jiangxiensis]|uniref:Uncharacterized protein n=1 Tax=Paludibacter jiangxiensis TaxID=681398 RepID=A0A171ACU3_9BACT|nr:hypothetical protein [Paludibacter jiangxiensis]GAT63536.1 hypothetical protein PJIAN_474 [Paludibacter jiangxiensis]